MHDPLAAALLGDGGDAGEALEGGRGGVAVPLRTQGRQQPRSQDGAGAGEAGEEGVVGVPGEELGDLAVVLDDGAGDQFQLAANQLDAQGEGVQQGGFVGQRHSLGDAFEPLGDQGLAAGAVGLPPKKWSGGAHSPGGGDGPAPAARVRDERRRSAMRTGRQRGTTRAIRRGPCPSGFWRGR